MLDSLRGFAAALLILWTVLCIAAYLFSRDQGIPPGVAFLLLPAFLLEAGMYFASGTAAVRARLERLGPGPLALLMVLSAAIPYLLAAAPLGLFRFGSLAAILALAAAASFFYVLLPPKPWADALFLALLAAVVLLKVFPRLYPQPHQDVPLALLGASMWVRNGMLAVLSLRKVAGVGFGFWPRKRDWRIGLVHYALFLPVGIALAAALGFVAPRLADASLRILLLAIGTFFGVLWVLALSEEFFFRGLLQQMLAKALSSDTGGLVLASLLFGAVHLPYRGFPNWRFALLAAFAGLFYGRAFNQAQSIRAAMVTHALVVTTWRVFLT
ncbi:MAG: CPBP family intramembrane metalloprotease [Acidobacteria bacterium]|nr:CPBP family intramembrane metalloprotease [Acidobacteriota bacterium]